MKTYIILQMLVTKQEQKGNIQDIELGDILRQVEANSEEEVIGKFIKNTSNISGTAHKALQIECILLDNFLKIS